jgi:hypothetical protein
VEAVLPAKPYEIAGSPRLLATAIHGDWVVREGTTAEERAAALAGVLHDQRGLNLTIERSHQNTEVIVIRGASNLGLRPVQIYSDQLDDGEPKQGRLGLFRPEH